MNWFGDVKTVCLLAAIVTGALGIWLLLPRGNRRGQIAGTLLAAVSLGLLMSLLPMMGAWVSQVLFWILAIATAVAAVATISMRSPVYSAIWFGLTLLTTAGLFLLQGAQFLGVATIVVYAGAILVTFLFVLMLAQPQGHEYYDRISWGTLPTAFAALAGVLIVGGLTYMLTNLDATAVNESIASAAVHQGDGEIFADQHMAKLGGELFSRHLISVEVAGTLLLVALVGAVAIVIQGKEPRASTAALRGGGPSDA